ncbi:hypothetical protein [Cohnella nanjingensis]|uniref:Uncharacterized protein n=1 Tax=Cohnella nanjingensis TaxID=1387779 RepID=A0A7X0VDC3_9BACL|nr:hypothetical protein [Cohnella nanjingensis]MBB6669551.1 hypothetical protein [Cohnella nanjingensis]
MKNAWIKLVFAVLLVAGFASAHRADAAPSATPEPDASVPMLASLNQISPNQLRVSYDQPVDQAKGMNPTNYWIQSTSERTPTNIATLGMNDTVSKNNSLTAADVTIQAEGSGGQTFVLTFKKKIASGMPFKMIICYVTKPGAPPYSGDNGSAAFVGR